MNLHGILHQYKLHHLARIKFFPSMLYPRKESTFLGTWAAIHVRHGRGTGSGVCLQAALHPCRSGSKPRCVAQGSCSLLIVFRRDPSQLPFEKLLVHNGTEKQNGKVMQKNHDRQIKCSAATLGAPNSLKPNANLLWHYRNTSKTQLTKR